MNNTSFSKALAINLENGRVYLSNLVLPDFVTFDIQVPKGIVNIQLPPSEAKQHFSITQTYGAICLSGGEITDYSSSEDCPS